MFNKKNFKKSSSGSSIYKTSSNNGIESESEFFWYQNESIFRRQIRAKLLNSKQLYCASRQPYVTQVSIKLSPGSLLATRLLILRYLIPLIPQKLSLCSFKPKTSIYVKIFLLVCPVFIIITTSSRLMRLCFERCFSHHGRSISPNVASLLMMK